RPADATLLEGCLVQHVEQFGRAPESVAADPGFFSAANESKAEEMGVRRVSIPSHDTKSPARKQRQKQRWFKKLQKWRTGCEGRISVLKRRHGLATDILPPGLFRGNVHRSRTFSRNLLSRGELETARAHHRARQKRPDQQAQPPDQGSPRLALDAAFPRLPHP